MRQQGRGKLGLVLYLRTTVLAGAGGSLNVETTFPQWGAADAEIKVPSGENTSLNVLPL